MKPKEIEILMPEYMLTFRCIGSACEDTCCKGWRVEIDKETYFLYKKSKHPQLQERFDRCIKRNRKCNNDNDYGKIVMDEEKKCPFLDAEGLCQIQLSLGADYLSKTCWSYPRIHNIIDYKAERAGVLSCPEVVRKAVCNPKGISFVKAIQPYVTKEIVVGELNLKDAERQGRVERFFWDIRIFCLALLQNRQYTTDQRMVLLGMFLQNLGGIIENKESENIPFLINTFDEMVKNNEFESELKNIEFRPETQINVIRILMQVKKSSGISGHRYLKCFNETVFGLMLNKEQVDIDRVDFTFFNTFIHEKDYILENYVVSEFYREMMPFGKYENIWESYISLCVMFSMVKTHLLGMSVYRNQIDEEMAVELIQSLSKEVSHNPVLFQEFIKVIRDSGFNTLQYLALLTRHPLIP